MQTVKLFKVTCTKAYEISGQGTRFSLAPWGKDTFYYKAMTMAAPIIFCPKAIQ
jgi:hypothetical protein